MSRKPSTETQLRTAIRELREEEAKNSALRVKLAVATEKAEHLEKDRNEWKARFDLLLSKCGNLEAEARN